MTQLNKFKNATTAFDFYYVLLCQEPQNGIGTKALENISFTINSTNDFFVESVRRKTPRTYAEAEWQWYMSGNRDATDISKIAKMWQNMLVSGTSEVNSNYGYFWKYEDQLSRAIELMRSDPDTRRAIVVHYDINELSRYDYDTPCNVVLNFYIKDGAVCLTVFARSIDLVFGFCNDFYIFARLLNHVATDLGKPTGTMHWFITNLHIYERHFDL